MIIQIKNAIEAAFGVNVVAVNTMNYRADRSVKYTKSGLISGKTNAIKKAMMLGTFWKMGYKNRKWISFHQVKFVSREKRENWLAGLEKKMKELK